MRTRSRPVNSYVSFRHRCDTTQVGTISGASTGSYGSLTNPWLPPDSVVETMTDEVTPGFFGKSRRKQDLPVNDMTQTRPMFEANWVDLFYDIKRTGYTGKYSREYHGTPGAAAYIAARGVNTSTIWTNVNTSGLTSPSMPNKAVVLQSALAKANTDSWDLLTFAAEFSKTSEMVRRAGQRTLHRAEVVAEAIAKKYRRTERSLDLFSNVWLEARYGWRPLMYDLGAAQEAIIKLQEHTAKRRRYYATDSNESEASLSSLVNQAFTKWNPSYSSSSSNLPLGYQLTLSRKAIKKTVRAGLAVDLIGQNIYMSDPLVTAWEIIPFSFVADWFITVGDAIAAHSPFARTRVLWAYTTEITESVNEIEGYLVHKYPSLGSTFYLEGFTSPLFYFRHTVANRTRVTSTPEFELDFELNFDYKKAADLAALFVPSLFKTFKKFGISLGDAWRTAKAGRHVLTD